MIKTEARIPTVVFVYAAVAIAQTQFVPTSSATVLRLLLPLYGTNLAVLLIGLTVLGWIPRRATAYFVSAIGCILLVVEANMLSAVWASDLILRNIMIFFLIVAAAIIVIALNMIRRAGNSA